MTKALTGSAKLQSLMKRYGTSPKAMSGITDLELEKRACTENLLSFTRVFFRITQGAEFARSDHHRTICRALERVFRGECKRLMINIPPRHSKTVLAVVNFVAWCYAHVPRCKFIHLSYSNDLVSRNCKDIQGIMRSDKYRAFWPESALLGNRDRAQLFQTEQGGEFYTASTGGQVTGFGAGTVDALDDMMTDEEIAEFEASNKQGFTGAIIIDDPIKPADALYETIRERVNEKFENTVRSRINSVNTPIIIIMQRTHEHDLCGYLQELEPEEWEVISLPAISIDEDGNEKALWENKMSIEDLRKVERADKHTFDTQYQQEPKPREGLLYDTGFREYEILPNQTGQVTKSVTDTASSGSDYYCSIAYIETKTAMYVTDIVYTTKNTDFTTPKNAAMLTANGTREAFFEANNGGDQICKAVKQECILSGNTRTRFSVKHQSDNKEQRIRLAAPSAQNLILFPRGWERRWPEFASHITSHRYIAAYNKNDDAPEGLTYMVENFQRKANNFIII